MDEQKSKRVNFQYQRKVLCPWALWTIHENPTPQKEHLSVKLLNITEQRSKLNSKDPSQWCYKGTCCGERLWSHLSNIMSFGKNLWLEEVDDLLNPRDTPWQQQSLIQATKTTDHCKRPQYMQSLDRAWTTVKKKETFSKTNSNLLFLKKDSLILSQERGVKKEL